MCAGCWHDQPRAIADMKSPTSSMWCLVLVSAAVMVRCLAALNTTWWPCHQITPQPDVQLEKVLGRWYMVEDVSQLSGGGSVRFNVCVSAILVQRDSGPGLVMAGVEEVPNGHAVYQNNTLLPAGQQGLWEVPDLGAAAAVVYLKDDVLALTHCYRPLQFLWTAVFSRAPRVSTGVLDDVNHALVSAGVPGMDHAEVRDPAYCD